MKKIKAKLGMSRAGMGSDSYMRMEIEDDSSGIRFIELAIPMEAFAYLVSGMHGVEADCELHDIECVGMKKELKTIDIEIPDDMPYKVDDSPEHIEDLLSPYEVDGWKAYTPDLFNYQRCVRGEKKTQTVAFHRYVEADDNAED